MTDTERILAEIAKLREDINHRVDGMESRLDMYEDMLQKSMRTVNRQKVAISELEQKVKELSETAAVWRSHDLREVGIDRDTAYDAFRNLGYSNRDALKALEKAGILRREGRHLTKTVRKGNRIIRAVVIMEDEA